MSNDRVRFKGTFRRGQKLYSHLYGGHYGIILAVHGEQKPETIGEIGGFMVTGGNANIDVVFENHYSKMLPESIVRGVQWTVLEEDVTEAEIMEAVARADAVIAKAKADDERRSGNCRSCASSCRHSIRIWKPWLEARSPGCWHRKILRRSWLIIFPAKSSR